MVCYLFDRSKSKISFEQSSAVISAQRNNIIFHPPHRRDEKLELAIISLA